VWFLLPLEFQSLFVFRSSHIAVELSHALVRFKRMLAQKRSTLGYSRPPNDRGRGSAAAILRSLASSRPRVRRAAVSWDTRRVLTQLMPVVSTPWLSLRSSRSLGGRRHPKGRLSTSRLPQRGVQWRRDRSARIGPCVSWRFLSTSDLPAKIRLLPKDLGSSRLGASRPR